MWFHFCSHKLGRLMLPWALMLVAISTPALPDPLRWIALTFQILFYGLAGLDTWIPAGSPFKRVSSIVRTFVVLVAAALWAPPYLLGYGREASGWNATEVAAAAASRHTGHPR
jgi:hypothetical protein